MNDGEPTSPDIMREDDRTDLLTDYGQLVVLELLQRLLGSEVADDTRGVDHTGTKEPAP